MNEQKFEVTFYTDMVMTPDDAMDVIEQGLRPGIDVAVRKIDEKEIENGD